MKRSYLITIILAMCAMAGCSKEEDFVSLNVNTTPYQSGSKTYIDSENYSCWNNGDQVRINNVTRSIVINDDRTNCKLNDIPYNANGYVAFYPASMATDATTLNSSIISNLILPSVQTYATDPMGNQQVPTIMAAYLSSGTGHIRFKNACVALKVNVTNNYSLPLSIGAVTVSDNQAPLSGSFNITGLTDEAPRLIYNSIASDNDSRSVTLAVNNQLQLSVGASATLFVVIPPTQDYSGNKFTIKVAASPVSDEPNTIVYEFSHQQSNEASGCFERNTMVPININLADPAHTMVLNGKGTQVLPYLISTIQDLQSMQQLVAKDYQPMGSAVAFSNAWYSLQNDINASGAALSPIGTAHSNFTGHFNGNNHTISNLTVTSGLFGYVSHNAVIFDLTVNGAAIDANGQSSAGVICAHAVRSTINHCRILGNVTFTNLPTSASYIGGIVGDMVAETTSNGMIQNCHCGASITLANAYESTRLGGIAGHLLNSILRNCYTRLNTTSNSTYVLSASNAIIGGIVGRTDASSQVSNCYLGIYDQINGTDQHMADICGDNSTSTLINHCYYPHKLVATGPSDGNLIQGNAKMNLNYIVNGPHLGMLLNNYSDQNQLMTWTTPTSSTQSPELQF